MSRQMYDDQGLGRLAAAWMTDDVAGTADMAHLDQILSATRQMRRPPRWLALLKEPPMRIQTQQRIVAGSPARRPILVVAGIGLLILALVAAVVGAQLLFKPDAASADWPGFRGDASHSGVSADGPSGRPVVSWTYEAPASVSHSIAIVDELVYALSDDGVLRALDFATGAVQWSRQVSDAAGGSGPAVVGGTVYVFDGAGRLHALDALTGAERWTSTSIVTDPNEPVIAGGFLYVGTSDGEIASFDGASGELRWRARIAANQRVNNVAADASGVYAATAGAFIAIDAASGAERWRVDTGTDVTGTATVADGTAYVGGGESELGRLRAIDAASGQARWTIDEPLFSPTVANGVLYTSDRNGALAAIDAATGRFLWRIDFDGVVRAPAYAEGVLFVPADGEQRIYAIDAATGGELWSFELGVSNQCCISVAKGSVFVGTVTGAVYRISGDGSVVVPGSIATGPVTPTLGPSPSGPPATVMPPVAEYISRSAGPGQNFFPPAGIKLDNAGRIWAPDPINGRFAIFDPEGTFIEYWGEPGDGEGQFDLSRENDDGYGQVAFAPDGSFYVLDAGNFRVQRFDSDRQFVGQWGGFGTGPSQYTNPVGIAVDGDGFVYVVDDVRGLAEKYEPDGTVVETIDVFSNAASGFNQGFDLVIDAEGNLYISQGTPNQVSKFSPDGDVLATYGASGPGTFRLYAGAIAVDAEGRVYVAQAAGRGSTPGVMVYEPDGTYIGGFGPEGSSEGQLDFTIGVAVNAGGDIFVLDGGAILEDNFTSGSLQVWRSLRPLGP